MPDKVKGTASKIKNLNRPVSDFTVKGKSVDDLVNLTATQLRDMNRSQLAKVVSRLGSAGNKRLVRFAKAGITTPATRHAEKKGKFSVKGKDIAQLRTEYKRVKGFLTSETSTRKGYSNYIKRVKRGLKNAGVEFNDSETEDTALNQMLEIYDYLKERNPWIEDNRYKYETQRKITESLEDGQSVRSIKRKLNKWLKEEYEKEQRESNQDVSDFFDIGE